METWNRLTVTRGEGQGGKWWKEGEGTRKRTSMNDPWTWTTVWELTVGAGGGMGGGEQREKIWNYCNGITIKSVLIKKVLLFT